MLPWPSAAEQVTRVVPIAKVSPEAGAQEVLTEPSTMSEAETVKLTTAPLWLVASILAMSAGTVTTGGVVSRTVRLNIPLAVFPWESLAVQ